MKRGAKVALVVLGIAVAAAPFWVALVIPFEEFAPPSAPAATASSREILTDLRRWDAATSESRRAAAEDVARRLPDFALLRLETFSCGGQTHEVAIYTHAKTGMEFVLVPVGTFAMGSPAGEAGRSEHEGPQHAVTLTRPFLICRTERTQVAYEKITRAIPFRFTLPHEEEKTVENVGVATRKPKSTGPTLPVETVSWDDSIAFCATAGLELPSDAQWEYACRAGTPTAYCFGDSAESLGEYAWFADESDDRSDPPYAVARKRANAFGLYDVHGNVSEWCRDWCAPKPGGSETDPVNETVSKARVIRGGGHWDTAEDARSAQCLGVEPDGKDDAIGFRPAKTVPSE